jgi:hypothetical protein
MLLAACGGDGDDDDGNGGQPQATSSTPQSEEPTVSEQQPTADAGEPSADVDQCDLYSKDEAAALIGEPVMDAETGAAACVYSAESIDSYASVSVSLLSFDNPANTSTVYTEGKTQVAAPEDVPGLGDEAYWDPEGGFINVLAGNHFVVTAVSFADGQYTTAEAREAATTVAETAVGRLP